MIRTNLGHINKDHKINMEDRVKKMDTENLKMKIITVQMLASQQEGYHSSRSKVMAHLHGQVLRIIIVLIIINPQVQVKNLDL